MEQAKKELEDIAAILATVQEPGTLRYVLVWQSFKRCHTVFGYVYLRVLVKAEVISEPGLLNELSRRVEAAEREFVAQDLDQKLRDLEAAKQRQVTKWGKV